MTLTEILASVIHKNSTTYFIPRFSHLSPSSFSFIFFLFHFSSLWFPFSFIFFLFHFLSLSSPSLSSFSLLLISLSFALFLLSTISHSCFTMKVSPPLILLPCLFTSSIIRYFCFVLHWLLFLTYTGKKAFLEEKIERRGLRTSKGEVSLVKEVKETFSWCRKSLFMSLIYVFFSRMILPGILFLFLFYFFLFLFYFFLFLFYFSFFLSLFHFICHSFVVIHPLEFTHVLIQVHSFDFGDW